MSRRALTAPPIDVPHYGADLFTDDALADPYPHLRACCARRGRSSGSTPTRCMPWPATPKFGDVLADDTTFISGAGVGLNEVVNRMGPGTTLMSDGAEHRTQREIIGRPLTPSALADLRQEGQTIADALVGRLVGRGRFDAVTDLAEVLPATWVPDLLGWPVDGRARLLDWAAATFNGLGPMNERAAAAGEAMLEMIAYAQQLAGWSLPEHCFAAGILRAAQQGEIEASRCPMLLVDYLGPSLDTTISAIANAIWLLATHPDQWQLLRDDPHRVKATVNEALRLESPISCFTRVAAGGRRSSTVSTSRSDPGCWSASPPPTATSDAGTTREHFDITRESAGQLAFGHGEHACVRGMGLARLEAAAVLSALIEQNLPDRARGRAGAKAQQPHPLLPVPPPRRHPRLTEPRPGWSWPPSAPWVGGWRCRRPAPVRGRSSAASPLGPPSPPRSRPTETWIPTGRHRGSFAGAVDQRVGPGLELQPRPWRRGRPRSPRPRRPLVRRRRRQHPEPPARAGIARSVRRPRAEAAGLPCSTIG